MAHYKTCKLMSGFLSHGKLSKSHVLMLHMCVLVQVTTVEIWCLGKQGPTVTFLESPGNLSVGF